ncbi:electron transporter [Thermomonospora catenispora]|nr:electron transporter [Thermomonospora catenispora]
MVWAGLAGLAVVAAVALAVFQPWLLFVDETVNDGDPAAAAPATPGDGGRSPQGPQVLAGGSFISHEHRTSGTVKVLRLADGARILRIEDLDTSNGPDLWVRLSDQPVKEGPGGWFVFDDGAYVELGRLKGNKGSQNYRIPADADLSRLTSVTIWCKRFHVSFGAAALRAA